MRIRLKRAYEEPSSDDGKRILVDRMWPRGLTREFVQLYSWQKDFAPSHSLRNRYSHRHEMWDEFRRDYREELCHNHKFKEWVNTLYGEITLIYASRDRDFNNAVVMREILENFEEFEEECRSYSSS